MSESRVPRGAEWHDIIEVLHAFSNVMTVRKNYGEGHPAIARADAAAASGFARVLAHVPELVVALLDGEFVVSERPLPELRSRIGVLADSMTRHEVECIVFQKGITAAECAILGKTLNLPPSPDPAKLREETQTLLAHVLLRFAELKAADQTKRKIADAEYLVPAVGSALYDAARAIASEQLIDRDAVLDAALRVTVACNARVYSLEQRAYAVGQGDEPTHAMNVALMTAAMAIEAGYPDDMCISAAAAALLHDIGQIFLSPKIRGVPEPLLADAEDKARFRNHPSIGAAALLAAGCPPLWVSAALEHHRGVDGGGYPTLASKRGPHEIVRMIALASFFDRKRTLLNGRGDDPEHVIEQAIALEDRYFGRSVVRLFLRTLGVYPPGTTVELSTRESAIVVNANPGDPLRPQVRVLFGDNDGKRIDLKNLDAVEDRHRVSIVRAIAPPLALRGAVAVADVAPLSARAAAAAAAVEAPAPAAPEVEAEPPRKTGVLPPARTSVEMAAVSLVASLPPIVVREEKHEEAPAPPRRPSSTSVRILSSLPPRTLPPRTPSSAPPPTLERLGPPDAIVKMNVSATELMTIALDPRAGFILSLVDGASTLETIVDLSGFPEEDATRILADLIARGVVALR
jgi:HD-GYP domain-containing protein (c-di-GMP phosphodiesterase class II)